MKNRNLFTNILSILIIIALAFFLLVQFNVFSGMSDSAKSLIGIVSLAIAIVSVILIDIVFPVIENRARLSEKKYLIFFIIKVVLFAAAVTVLLLFHPFAVIRNTTVALVSFIVLYFIQFFINLDAKPDDDDDEEVEDEDVSESDDDDSDIDESDVVSEDIADDTETDESSYEDEEESGSEEISAESDDFDKSDE